MEKNIFRFKYTPDYYSSRLNIVTNLLDSSCPYRFWKTAVEKHTLFAYLSSLSICTNLLSFNLL